MNIKIKEEKKNYVIEVLSLVGDPLIEINRLLKLKNCRQIKMISHLTIMAA